MKMTKQWEKEWQEIKVPQEAVFQAIEKGLGVEAEIKGNQKYQPKKLVVLLSFIKKNSRLLAVAFALMLLTTAGIASISSNRQMEQLATSSQNKVIPKAKKTEAPAAETKAGSTIQEKRGEDKVELNEGDAASKANSNGEMSDESPQKLTKNYQIIKETTEFSQVIEKIDNTVKKHNGYFSQSDRTNQQSEGQLRSANYIIRIPLDQVEDFVKALAKIGETVSSSENATDHSLSYSDNQSRIKALQTEEEALLKLLGKSDTVQDMINIQDRLSQVRSSKESLIQQNKLIDNQVAETEVSLSVSEVKAITKEKSTTIFSRVEDNWQGQLRFWQGLGQQLAVFFLSAGPYLVAILVLVGIVWGVIKKRRV